MVLGREDIKPFLILINYDNDFRSCLISKTVVTPSTTKFKSRFWAFMTVAHSAYISLGAGGKVLIGVLEWCCDVVRI